MEKKDNDSVELDKKMEKKVVKTAAEKIWEDIKGVQLEMFSLPDQTVELHCTPVNVEPSKLYLVSKVGSVVPALEAALHKKYEVELAQKYIVVSPKSR